MVLGTYHQLAGGDFCRGAAMPSSSELRIAAGEDKAFLEALDQIGKTAEVAVVSGPLTGQQGLQGMVKVVVPLGMHPIAS